ncbi:hypothetical protein [Algibacillus agarilyticus]|uniref:hypothetical protein n=1 Tax=Algibacillus agarilyticus TaxID=2234133 RepID=UPI000DCFD417|nr:hypothetical protein [Algibacillus agarilyticus]
MKYKLFSFLLLVLSISACGGSDSGAADNNQTLICDNGGTDYPACTAPVCDNGGTDYPACTAPMCDNGGSDYPACTVPVCDNGGSDYPACTAPVCDNGGTDYPVCTAPVCLNGGTDYPVCTVPVCLNGGADYPVCTDPTLPEFLDENDFFNDTSVLVPAERKRILTNVNGNDSKVLNDLITELNAQGGGIINIPAGNWLFGEIVLRSNVHLFIDPAAIITPVRVTWNGPTFHLGYNDLQVKNVSIRSTSATEKFTIDMSGLPDNLYPPTTQQEPRVMPFRVSEVENFMVSGAFVIDKHTIHSSVNFIPSVRNGIYAGANKGLVKDITVKNAHGGYGAVQTRVGSNVFFKNINSLSGGSTLRIETDAPHASGYKAPIETMVVSNIFGYNIGCNEGNSAVMIQPWAAVNGRFDVQKISSNSCGAAVRIDRAFVEWQTTSGEFTNPNNLPVGSFAADSRITDINATYGTKAQVKQGTFPFIPCDLRHLYQPEILMETFHQGPSISPLLYAASSHTLTDSRFYDIDVPTEDEIAAKSIGFPAASLIISRDEQKLPSCN